MKNNYSPFQTRHGADRIRQPIYIIGIFAFGLILSFVLSKAGIVAGLGLLILPFAIFFLKALFTYPKIGIYSTVIFGFFVNGSTRYVQDAPFGLLVDGLLIFTYLAIAFKKTSFDWSKAKNGLTAAAAIWMLYNFMEILNPQPHSFAAWFYAMRAVSLYMILAIPLTLVLLDKREDLNLFLTIWLIISLLGSLQGLKQQVIGVDSFEKAWLDAGAYKQHILFGKLRVFSFYSDAGQFGASQGHALVVATILFLQTGLTRRQKYFYLACAVFSLIGMMISGTRGALSVPIIGFTCYLAMSKNFKVLGLGAFMGGVAFYLLKFTSVGQNIYAINRMRTGLDPNDPSLLVRFENQKKLANYLSSRPFGGGVGSAGSWGLRFTPNTLLAQTPTDSWYVRIWAEEGMVGLTLHLMILFYIAYKGVRLLWNLPDKNLRQQGVAILSGTLGIYMASYGNGILGQFPTGILLYVGWAFLFQIDKLQSTTSV